MTSHRRAIPSCSDRSAEHAPGLRDDRGFALVAVIWITTILAAAAFMLTQAARTGVRTIEAGVAGAQAEAAADAAVHLAMMDVMETFANGGQQRAFDGSIAACRLDDESIVAIRIQDEAGKIDVNVAAPDLLRALMAGLGWPASLVDVRVDTLLDFIDADNDRRPAGGEAEDYPSSGPEQGPKNGPLKAIEELARVKGFDDKAAQELRPFVTVYSGQSGVDPRVTSQTLAAMLARGERFKAFDISVFSAQSPSIPSEFVATSTAAVFTIQAEAITKSNAHFVRDAIISLRPAPGGPTYKIWRWTRGISFAARGDDAVLPSC